LVGTPLLIVPLIPPLTWWHRTSHQLPREDSQSVRLISIISNLTPNQEIPVEAVPIWPGRRYIDGLAGRAEVDHVVKPPPSTLERNTASSHPGQVWPPLTVGRPARISSLSKEAFQDPGESTTWMTAYKPVKRRPPFPFSGYRV